MFIKDKAKIAALRRQKFLDYCAKHRIEPARCKCLCSRPAVGIKFNSPACAICLGIEADLSTHHGNIWASNPDRVKDSKYRPNRLKAREVGAFDPDIYGLSVAL